MKLLSLIPTPQHVVTAEINNRTQGQVIDITVYNETKSFRAVSVADNEVEKTDGRSFGRSSNTFWAAMYNGKEILLFVQGTGIDRAIEKILAQANARWITNKAVTPTDIGDIIYDILEREDGGVLVGLNERMENEAKAKTTVIRKSWVKRFREHWNV